MEHKQIKILQRAPAILLAVFFFASYTVAEEKIIQQEKISFEKCLKVITTSQDKLSIAPEITDVSSNKRIAIFSLVDGILMITCDGLEGNVVVSTKQN